MRGNVLITDGDQRSALTCVRSLGRAGYRCFVVGPEKGSLAAYSHYSTASGACPDPLTDPTGFLQTIRDRIADWGIDILFPMTEKALRQVLPHRHEFGGVKVPFPDAAVFERVSDKGVVLEVAKDLGLLVPRQWTWSSLEQAQEANVPGDAFPLALKPPRSVDPLQRSPANRAVRYVADPADLEDWVASADAATFPILAQERVEGEGVGVFVLTWGKALKAVVGHRRIREKPPSGGVSVVRDSTVPDDGLLDRSLSLLRHLGWSDGVAMVEYKVERGSGRPYLMEINGRFWGSLQLAVDAGVDFPVLLIEAAQGRLEGPVVRGRPGVRTRWLLGDLDQLLLRLRRPRKALDLPEGVGGRLEALWSFLRDFRPGVRLEVLRASDLRPFLAEARHWVRTVVR